MIGLRRNKRGDMVLTIDSYIDIDSTPDIQPDYFDCIYINTKSEHAFHDILFGASPILSWKCSYKPIFVNTAVSGKEQIIDYIVDAYVSDMNNEKVYEIIDRIKMARQKFGVKSETSHPTQPNQLFANILRYLLSRDQRIMGHRLLEKSSLGYINPIFEHYHSMGLFHLNEMFMFIDTMVEFGSLRIHRFLLKEHLCPKCNHCPKCHKKLRHIGVDYDRPAVVYTCNDCENSFTSPITKATCCYCQSTFPVNTLVPRNIEDYEITEEGIRTLTSGNIMFNNMVNIYDNFMEYYLLMNRLRRQLMETYRKDELSVMVGKIWIIDENKDTVKIKESIQGKLCRIFSNHKVSYYNNIFYVSSTLYELGETVEEAQQKLSKEMSVAIRKVANSMEPDEIICSMLETKTKTIANNYDEFFNKLQYVDMTPDDYCRYSEEPLMKEEEKLVQPQEELLDTEPKEDENDKIQKRIVLYKKLVDILVTIAGILIIMALLALTVLR